MRVLKTASATLLLCATVFALTTPFSNSIGGSPGALRLEIYKGLHETDPIFAYPGTDTDALQVAIDALRVSAKVALPTFSEDEVGALYPFEFLSAIPKTEKARRALLKEKTFDSAELYHLELTALIDAYTYDITKARALLKKDHTSYRFFSGETTPKHIDSILAEASSLAESKMEEESRRYKCLTGHTLSCRTAIKAERTSPPQVESTGKQDIPLAIEQNKNSLSALYPSLTESEVVSLTHSACFTHSPAYFAVAREPSRLSGVPTMKLVYLNDLYLDDLSKATHPFYKALFEAGATFTYQPFNPYLCPDYGIDVQKVLTIVYVKKTVSDTPFIFKHGYLPPILRELKESQDRLQMESPISEELYTAFINDISKVASVPPYTLKKYMDDSAYPRLLQLITLSKAHSAYLEQSIGYFDDLQIGSYVPAYLEAVSPHAFLVSRGGISQLFALQNRTTGISMASLQTSRTNSQSLYRGLSGNQRSYEDDLRASLSREDLRVELQNDQRAKVQAFLPFIQKLLEIRDRASHARTP